MAVDGKCFFGSRRGGSMFHSQRRWIGREAVLLFVGRNNSTSHDNVRGRSDKRGQGRSKGRGFAFTALPSQIELGRWHGVFMSEFICRNKVNTLTVFGMDVRDLIILNDA